MGDARSFDYRSGGISLKREGSGSEGLGFGLCSIQICNGLSDFWKSCQME